MYADDIVLMSESEEGLKAALKILGDYCVKWKLQINLNKTKIVVFRNCRSKYQQYKFTLLGQTLGQATSYKYLGLNISDLGRFDLDCLINKARKAFFNLRQQVFGEKLTPRVMIDLFFKMIVPIATYGSEIWGSTLISPRMKTTTAFWKKCESLKIEKLVFSMARCALGVHKNTTKAAIRGELGLYPLGINICKFMLKYYIRLIGKPPDSLLGSALKVDTVCNRAWINSILKLKQLNITSIPQEMAAIPRIIKDLRTTFQLHWLSIINKDSSNKLRTYNQSKFKLNFENYLIDIKNEKHRKAFTRLRTASHFLHIETGRYSNKHNNPLSPSNRICQLCTKHEIEDEQHFAFSCTLYEDIRNNLFRDLENYCPNLDNKMGHCPKLKLSYLFSSEGEIARAFGKFCYLAFEKRHYNMSYNSGTYVKTTTTTRTGRLIKVPIKLNL